MSELLFEYFPELKNDKRGDAFRQMKELYAFWNAQINVISRKDMESFYERHVLHSLAIAKKIQFKPGTRILDIGTGGGFPGVPLAAYFPECEFTLVDSIGKKIKVVKEVSDSLGLKNVQAFHSRVEEIPGKFDFIVSRAVAPMIELADWTIRKIAPGHGNDLANGFLFLKGGDLTAEQEAFKEKYKGYRIDTYVLSDWYSEDFFSTKQLLHSYQLKR